MTEHDEDILPQPVRDGLDRARDKAWRATGGRLRVQVGTEWYPILSCDPQGFEVSPDVAPKLRGHVEIHEGPRLIRAALVVAAEARAESVRYVFKRSTEGRATPPLDYERIGVTPAGYLDGPGDDR